MPLRLSAAPKPKTKTIDEQIRDNTTRMADLRNEIKEYEHIIKNLKSRLSNLESEQTLLFIEKESRRTKLKDLL